MEIIFDRVDGQNFQSLSKVSLDLSEKGITLVRGINEYEDNSSSNGSGKSSCFEMILWAIYGKTSAGISDTLKRDSTKDCTVDLYFHVDSNEYKITRTCSSKKSSVSLYKFYNNTYEDISGRNKTDTDKLIREIIKFDSSVFQSTIFLTQGFSGKFSALAAKGKKERIETITESTSKIDSLLSLFNDKKDEYKGNVDSLSLDLSKKDGEINILNKNVSDLRSSIAGNSGVLNTLEELDSYEDTLAELNRVKDIAQRVKGSYDKVCNEEYTNKTGYTTLQNKVNTNQKSINELSSKISTLREDKKCPLCNQSLSDNDSLQIIIELDDKCNALNKSIEDDKKVMETLYTNITDLSSQKELLTKKYETLESVISELQNNLAIISKYSHVEDDKNKLEECEKELSISLKDREDINHLLDDANSLYELAQHNVNIINKQFRAYVLNTTIDFMNERLLEYSNQLFSNDKDVIKIVIDSSDLDVYVGNALYDSLSGGEKRKVDIALVFAQRDLAMVVGDFSSNLLILDETMENLDEYATQIVLEMITGSSKNIDSLFIISHNNYDIEYNSIMTVTKDSNMNSFVKCH